MATGVTGLAYAVVAVTQFGADGRVPNEALSNQRQRLETAIKRLGDRYQWQEIEEREYREERATLQAQLAELPPPADSNVVAFDRTSEHLLPIATIIRETTPEHQTALIKHIVECVTITDGEVTDIGLRPEARPFYAGLVMAPRTDSSPQQPRRLPGLLPRGRIAG